MRNNLFNDRLSVNLGGNVSNNNLESLRIDNGNNTNISYFESTGNSNLTCVTVDDAVYSTANWDEIDDDIQFTPMDYLEVIERFREYMEVYTDRERTILITLRKNIVWMAQGLPNVTHFRNLMFQTPDLDATMDITREYFDAIKDCHKKIDHTQSFMAGGHG